MASVLIMKTGQTLPAVAGEYGDFEDWIIAASGKPGAAFRTLSLHEGQRPPAPEQVRAVIVTGSPAMVTDGHDWIRRGEEFLRLAVASRIPVLGICFGHQLLAQALGGTVDFNPRGREIGTTRVSLTAAAGNDILFADMPDSFPAHVTHMQSVISLPAQATILAGNDFDSHQGVRFAENAWGVQFHPEFDAAIMAGYIRERAGQISAEGLDPGELLAQVTDALAATALLRRFTAVAD